MRLEVSKRYSYSFHKMLAKLYEDIGYHGEMQVVIFLPVSQVLIFFLKTLKF